jgi:hypothetical protein
VDTAAIDKALADISAEQDPTLKALKLSSLCSSIFREKGIELVVVGGSAIEAYTEGAYSSGDIDLCLANRAGLSVRERQELMAPLKAEGGPRSFQVAGMFVDILGSLESFARTPRRKLTAPYGPVELLQPEELLVERVLVAVYPGTHPPALEAARKLAAIALQGRVEMDWQEVKRLAELPGFGVWPECKAVVKEVCAELGINYPDVADQ